ncbi:MAG: hypothetical protein LIP00_11900 [Parabacteroides sp.]|nr:hypothetical protein [Parabacteroides sp.]
MKRINFTTALLFLYLLIVGLVTWPARNPHIAWSDYFVMLGATAFVIVLLRFVQVQRLRGKDKTKNGQPCERGEK